MCDFSETASSRAESERVQRLRSVGDGKLDLRMPWAEQAAGRLTVSDGKRFDDTGLRLLFRVGRGHQGAEKYRTAKQLADCVGGGRLAAVGSHLVITDGLTQDRQIGSRDNGRSEAYLAMGISGAIQNYGNEGRGALWRLTNDSDAPIFEMRNMHCIEICSTSCAADCEIRRRRGRKAGFQGQERHQVVSREPIK